MKHNIRKSEIIKRLGLRLSLREHSGIKPSEIKLTPNQFDRLLENYMDYEEFEMGENFGDGDLTIGDPTLQGMVTQSDDNYFQDSESPSELDEGMDDEMPEEDLDEMWANLAAAAAATLGAKAGEKVVDKYLEEKNDLVKSLNESYKIIRETIKSKKGGKLRLSNYNSRVISESFYGSGSNRNHPGESAAAGLENIINSIKKGYAFVKDPKTRKQIENTLVKLSNFMTYTAELMASGRDQRAPQSYDSVSKPLPYPDLDEPEVLEDIDDEIDMGEANWIQDVNKESKKDGTEGKFGDWCVSKGYKNGCSEACIEEGRRRGGVWQERADLAHTLCGFDD